MDTTFIHVGRSATVSASLLLQRNPAPCEAGMTRSGRPQAYGDLLALFAAGSQDDNPEARLHAALARRCSASLAEPLVTASSAAAIMTVVVGLPRLRRDQGASSPELAVPNDGQDR